MINEKQKLIDLQKKFEDGTIKEEELSEQEKSKLIELYKKQIEYLNQDIEKSKKTFEEYKEKIIEIRKSMCN